MFRDFFRFLLLVLVSVFFKQSLQLAEKMSSLNQKLRFVYIGDGSAAKTHATATATMTACSTSPGLPLQCYTRER
jgi:hypothetical protein